jgi:protein-S-isoprenylcysteine O-methyltransferase Ste14
MQHAVLALAWLCFLSFAWGMVWHFRRVGKPTPAMLATALAAGACAVVQIRAVEQGPMWAPWGALLLYPLSAGLFWWAVGATRGKVAACGQRCVSARVVRNGPYKYIRHPFYAAYNLTWIAGALAAGSLVVTLTAVAMAAIYEGYVRQEERGFLEGGLAEDYREYRRRARRYWPRTR